MLLDSISVGSSQFDDLRVFQAAVLFDQVDDLDTERWKLSHQKLFPLHLDVKACFLLLQCAQEKYQPRLPVWVGGADGPLGAAEREIVALFALFYHAFKRAIGHVFVAAAQQDQRC